MVTEAVKRNALCVISVLLVVLLVTHYASLITAVEAAHRHLEKEYQAVWCAERNGTTEYVLPDDTRVDCLTNEYAIEFDFGPKWAESIGQALYYALRTDRTPGVVLILERQSDRRYLKRIEAVADVYGIKVWIMEPKDLRP